MGHGGSASAQRCVSIHQTNIETCGPSAQLLPHAHAVVEHAEVLHIEDTETSRLLNEVGLFLHTRTAYPAAEPLYERALASKGAALGLKHPDVAIDLNNPAELYRVQGQYREAAALYERASGIMESTLRTHPNSATMLENFANCLDSLSRGEEAGQGAMGELRRAIKEAGRIQQELAQEAMQFDNAFCAYADR